MKLGSNKNATLHENKMHLEDLLSHFFIIYLVQTVDEKEHNFFYTTNSLELKFIYRWKTETQSR